MFYLGSQLYYSIVALVMIVWMEVHVGTETSNVIIKNFSVLYIGLLTA